MKRYFRCLFLFAMIFLVACGSNHSIDRDELAAYKVKQTFVQTEEDDFIFRLVSEKKAYHQG